MPRVPTILASHCRIETFRSLLVLPSPNAQPGPTAGPVDEANSSQPASPENSSNAENAEISAARPGKTGSNHRQECSWADMIRRIESVCALWFDEKPSDLVGARPLSRLEEWPENQ